MKLKTGELAKICGVGASTLMRYEEAELLKPSGRTGGNTRFFDDKLIDRVNFIKACRLQGLDYGGIKEILDFMDNSGQESLPEALIDKLIMKAEKEIAACRRFLKVLRALKKARAQPEGGEAGQ